MEWLATGKEPMWVHETPPAKYPQPAPPLDMRALTRAIALAQETLAESGAAVTPEQLADLAARIYHPLATPIQRLGVKAAAAQLATPKEPHPTSE